MWKDFFYYSRSERRVILLLLGLLIILGISWLVCWRLYRPEYVRQEDSAEIDSFLASVKQRETAYAKRNYTASGVRKGQEVVLFDFNPNTADSVQLKNWGYLLLWFVIFFGIGKRRCFPYSGSFCTDIWINRGTIFITETLYSDTSERGE